MPVRTERLEVRPPREEDRARFVELLCDDDFMVHYPFRFTADQASERFDHMVEVCRTVAFGKQPIVERATGAIVGYTGVDHIEIDGRAWLEWGYRLTPQCRGLGYATEAGRALLATAAQTYTGELLAIIAPHNLASRNVCRKLGFEYWKQGPVFGDLCNLYTMTI